MTQQNLLVPSILLVLCVSIASIQNQIAALELVLDDDSAASTYNWKISSNWFQYFQNGSDIENNVSLNLPDGIDLKQFKGTKGIWILTHTPHPKPMDLEDKEDVAYFEFKGGSQLYEKLTITGYLHSNSSFTVSTTSYHKDKVMVWDVCPEMKPQFKNFTLTLGIKSRFRIEANVPDAGDFIFIDKITATRLNAKLTNDADNNAYKLEQIKVHKCVQ